MRNFEKITASPEDLAGFLESLEVTDSAWDHAFARAFCDDCRAACCDRESCPHMAERDNPLWWLRREAQEHNPDKP